MEMIRRRIGKDEIVLVLSSPEQVVTARPGRLIYQKRREYGSPPLCYLLRVVVDVDRRPPVVVTAYRTSRIAKYWSEES